MKEKNPSRVHEVRDERAAALLMNLKTRQFLLPFIGVKRSVKEACDELGLKLANFYPYVKQFEDAGLIEVAEVLPRAGRAIKRYRSVADEFFVPHTVSPLLAHYEELEKVRNRTLWHAILQAWLTTTDEVNTWGLRFYKHPKQGFEVMGARSQGEPWNLFQGEEPIILPYWAQLKLSREKARAMQLELHDLLERYTAEQDGSDDYLIRIAMAPLPEHER